MSEGTDVKDDIVDDHMLLISFQVAAIVASHQKLLFWSLVQRNGEEGKKSATHVSDPK